MIIEANLGQKTISKLICFGVGEVFCLPWFCLAEYSILYFIVGFLSFRRYDVLFLG
jgi:hypothetical protein